MKTSTIHSNRKKGWPASLALAGLVLAALVLTGCPQPSGGGGGGGGGSQQQMDPPLAVTGLKATYNATAQAVTVNWSAPAGTSAHKYQVTVAGKSGEFFGTSATITEIAATEKEETVTVVGIAKDGTQGASATTKVKLTAKLAVAAIELKNTTLAPGAVQQATVSFTNSGKIGSGTVTLQLYKGDVAEEAAVNLTENSYGYTASLTAPAAVGTYTLKVLLDGTVVEGQTLTITVEEPQITEIKLNRTEVRPGATIRGTITGNGALATVSLSGTVTKTDNSQVGTIYSISNLEFSYTVPTGTADGTYTITISKQQSGSSTPLGTVDFTVNANAALPDMSNPFADGLSYVFSQYSTTTTWTVQGDKLVTTERSSYNDTTEENWYTFSHDTANKRITLTPSKLFSTNANKALNRADYEADLRASPDFSQDAMKSMFQQQIATTEGKAEIIEQIKEANPNITGLESMSDEQLFNTYISVMLKDMGYNTWDEWVAAMIQQELKAFDVRTTYSYVADSSTGSLKVTEWWDSNTTFKTLYDAGTNFSFSWYNSGSSGGTSQAGVTNVSVSKSYVSITENGSSLGYQITGISGNTINLKADSGGGTSSMTFGAITDAASSGSPQKQMTVTYNGQNYTLTHSLKNYNFSI